MELGHGAPRAAIRAERRGAAACKVPIWASSIGPSRQALLAGGLFGHHATQKVHSRRATLAHSLHTRYSRRAFAIPHGSHVTANAPAAAP